MLPDIFLNCIYSKIDHIFHKSARIIVLLLHNSNIYTLLHRLVLYSFINIFIYIKNSSLKQLSIKIIF